MLLFHRLGPFAALCAWGVFGLATEPCADKVGMEQQQQREVVGVWDQLSGPALPSSLLAPQALVTQ